MFKRLKCARMIHRALREVERYLYVMLHKIVSAIQQTNYKHTLTNQENLQKVGVRENSVQLKQKYYLVGFGGCSRDPNKCIQTSNAYIASSPSSQCNTYTMS